MAQSQLAQCRDDRHHIVNVEQTVGNEVVGIGYPILLPHRHGARLQVHTLRQIVRLGGVEAAAFAHRVANVVIPPVLIPQLACALGADAHVVQQIHAVRHVSRHPPDAEIAPLVPLHHAAGDEVVGIQDQLALFRQIPAENARNVPRMGVAHDGIPEQIGDQDIVGPHIGIDLRRRPLVDFQHCHVAVLHPAQHVAVADESRGHAGGDVAARPVAEDAVALRLQNVHQHIADGGLAVGAGDGHH